MPTKNNLDDAVLIEQLLVGNADAYIELYSRYHPMLYNWLIRMVKIPEIAEDIVQETFLKIWEVRHRLQPHQSFAAYLYRISRNKAFRILKKIAKDKQLRNQVINLSCIEYNDPERVLKWQQYQQLLDVAVSRLPNQRQKVFKLCRQDRKSYDEVAKELGISTNTVKEHMINALRDIRKYFRYNGEVTWIYCTILYFL